MSPTETNGQLQGLLLRKTLLLIASLVPAIAITPGARADICFEYGSGGGTSVAKGAKVPPVNTCIRVTPVDLGARLGVATGSICQVFLAVPPRTAPVASPLLLERALAGCFRPES